MRTWFLDQALPLWSRYGVDAQRGGFYERLHPSLIPSHEPRRARLVARQIYFFAAGGTLGWEGPVDELIDQGYQFLRQHLLRSDGQVLASCTATGDIIDQRQLLYDVAFVLLALAKIAQRRPESVELESLARCIVAQLHPHPLGGYIDSIYPDLQCANPHMHLFEAFLAWSLLVGSADRFWWERAAALADLATQRMIHPNAGALYEHFDQQWQPVPQAGSYRIEPGHQFEWSWLLAFWATISGDTIAATAGANLCHLAEEFGVDKMRNVVIESISEKFLPCDPIARLWQQAERLKAWHQQFLITGSSAAENYRTNALESFQRFLAGPCNGLWFDQMDASGAFVVQPVKASSGYHIACALEVLCNRFYNL
jgi:mannose/cellobiose epimerase-like protein (N-acyl-D-glucosamine 2-epimerase family)